MIYDIYNVACHRSQDFGSYNFCRTPVYFAHYDLCGKYVILSLHRSHDKWQKQRKDNTQPDQRDADELDNVEQFFLLDREHIILSY